MKIKILFLSLSVFCFVYSAKAQEAGIRKGSRFALGSSQFESPNFFEIPNQKFLFEASGMLLYGLNSYIGLRADLQFSYTSVLAKGQLYDGGLFNEDEHPEEAYKLFSVNLPLVFRLSTGGSVLRPYAEAGYMLQANLFGSESRTFENSEMQSQYGFEERSMNSLNNFGSFLVAGAGIELKANAAQTYFLEARIYHPTGILGRVDTKSFTYSAFSIGGGVLF
ncbi:MAG: hypothetical protein EP332_03385 [Bacteroidetes bacterium]|nr:MAG: hypothetical protein EP332_03385 [Bacteroidota bacterium]